MINDSGSKPRMILFGTIKIAESEPIANSGISRYLTTFRHVYSRTQIIFIDVLHRYAPNHCSGQNFDK